MSSDPDFRELEHQLSCPTGPKGVEVGVMMNETNIGMTMASVEALGLQPNDRILELGHGNGGHIGRVLSMADNVHYTGLEISATMHHEASAMLEQDLSRRVELLIYPAGRFPIAGQSVDKFFTVNTIYFWPDPGSMLNEIARVIKSEGRVVITYAQKEFMQGLPFVGEKFTLYNDEDLRSLVATSGLELVEIRNLRERVKSKSGESLERHYSVAVLTP